MQDVELQEYDKMKEMATHATVYMEEGNGEITTGAFKI